MSESDEDEVAIVMDLGSATCMIGFSGDDAPRAVVPSMVGHPRYDDVPTDLHQDTFIGDAAQYRRGVLSISYPIERGIVTNWDDLEDLLLHTFERTLHVSPNEHSVLLSEAAKNPEQNKAKLMEVMFEKFHVPTIYFASQGELTLRACGLTCGVAVNSGHGLTDILAVHKDIPIPQSDNRMDLGGHDLTVYLAELLRRRGYTFTSPNEMAEVQDIKEKCCYAALNPEEEMSKTSSEKEQTYTLPDGRCITITDERFQCTEALFDPTLLGMDCRGIHELVYDCLMNSPSDVRRDLCGTICLSGGNTMFPGLKEKLIKELRKLLPDEANIRVIAAPERKFLVWIGGSIVASVGCFNKRWITNEEYEEYGKMILRLR